MSFLFGDLSPAPFVTNFLEELRDALDFAGGIAEADQTIVTADARREEARKRADAELARLEALAWAMIAAAEAADRGAPDSPAARLAAELGMLVTERRQVSDAAVHTKLEEELRALDAGVVAAREDYLPTLQDWLLVRVPPQSKQTWRVDLIPGAKKDLHRYRAVVDGESPIRLAWSIALAPADDGPWAAPLRVSRVAEDLAIVTPQLTGLIKKEVKSKKHKIDRHWITRVVDDGETLVIELREELGDDANAEGFTIMASASAISLEKKGPSDDPTVGTFPLAPEDEPALRDFTAKLRQIVRDVPKHRLASATFDGLPFDGTNVESQPRLVEVVVRLVESLAPIVDEVATRSRSDTELVLRRELDGGKREEVFMPKAALLDKLAQLDAAHHELFAPITRALSVKAAEPAARSPSTIRSEIAQVEPSYVRRRSSGSMKAVAVPVVKDTDEEQKQPTPESVSPASTSTAALKDALKQARAATKEGNLDDAFRQYATIFGNTAFASTRPEDQRQALKLMFFGNQPEVANDEVKAAYRCALPILQALVLKDRNAADYELLGMAYDILGEREKAIEIFKKALDVERARDPGSDLCGNLMRRVSQL